VSADTSPGATRAGLIALTGATGFIGGRLVWLLCSAGWPVRVLVRSPARTGWPADLGLQQVSGSLEEPDSLQRLVAGAYAVVHCAGVVRGITRAQFNRVNVDGLMRLVQAAVKQQPLPRFLLLSSLAAREPALSPYAASKRQGEQVLAAAARNMPWAAFRPPAVYGPGERELLPLFQWMGRGIALVLGPKNARFSLLYVDDLAAAIQAWLNRPQCAQGVFELHDGHTGGYSWDDVVNIAATLCARHIRRIPVPAVPLYLLAALSVLLAPLGGYAPMLTPAKLRELRHPDWVCDNRALNFATGWAPQVALAEGLRRTLGWGTPVDS
jgi:nucleoside-diphosphate-sugar epimerase